jgi:hypothetical protein
VFKCFGSLYGGVLVAVLFGGIEEKIREKNGAKRK